MAIPNYQNIMLPLLKYALDGQEHSMREAIEVLADQFNLSEDERKELLPSGQQPLFDNRVGWARTYLKKAGLLVDPKRGYFEITEQGIKVARQPLQEIDVQFLNQFPNFINFKNSKKPDDNIGKELDEISQKTPQESIELGYQKIRQELEIDLINRVKNISPEFFERLVIDLLIKMGYGGSRRDAGKAIGKSGDGGIDGIIKEDKLGLDVVYIQAKRWNTNVIGRPEIQKFVGALYGQRAKKGVFITTSNFTQDAKNYVSDLDIKLVLIDGQELAQLMIDNNVGVSTVSFYEIKDIDSDYFIDG
ncbi:MULTISPECIES: restriction endonuclease [unclassified Nostoc]|uniref:restriction endonuclease n=1 Tax=unclassified Nostoc TaxID=2593658 RepID=UPI002AD206A9|nr:restriction endonuclease [Nostoc sp. DedQUE03]MDZ7972920.1 restriction endonuclease [Nostoc sp. DedQUE03]MDZ8044221.1 restriction endonuclease [Nostoc sp. DedQUE02]